MNLSDKKLLDFFQEAGNIEYYMANSQTLGGFYDECFSIIKNKTYSDINLQDERGNTYLHYLSYRSSWSWFIDLLNLGADPTIINKTGYNAFQVCPSATAIQSFWRIATIRDLDSFNSVDWDKKTQNFALNFKQFLFDGHLLNNNQSFNSIEDAIEFLQKSNLDTKKNRIKIVGISSDIEITQKISWYEEEYESLDDNNDFLATLIKATPRVEDKKIYCENINNFLKKNFIQNDSFNKIAKEIINESQETQNMEIYHSLLKSMIRQNFNFEVEADYNRNTLMKLIEKDRLTHKIFLDEILKKNASSKKIIKI